MFYHYNLLCGLQKFFLDADDGDDDVADDDGDQDADASVGQRLDLTIYSTYVTTKCCFGILALLDENLHIIHLGTLVTF